MGSQLHRIKFHFPFLSLNFHQIKHNLIAHDPKFLQEHVIEKKEEKVNTPNKWVVLTKYGTKWAYNDENEYWIGNYSQNMV